MSTLLTAEIRPVTRTMVLDPPLSDEELEAMCRANDTVQFERTREGVILMNPPAGGFTSRGNASVSAQLYNWWESHGKGMVFDSNGGFYLPDGSMLCPDASYVSPKRLEGLTEEKMVGFPRLCPEFVIELLSASDSLVSTQEKMVRWIENGITLGWLIDPYAKNVHIYAPGVQPAVFSERVIHGSGPVDGFALDLAKVWRCYKI